MKQTELMLEYLKKNKTITGIEALKKLGIICYTKCISRLRAQGVLIKTNFETKRSKFGVKRFARYVLVKLPKKAKK